jgi:hypothetical protein
MHSSLFPFAPISNRPSENKLPEASNGRTARRRAVLGRVPRGGSLLGDSEYTHATRIGPTTPTQGDESLSPPTQMVMPWAQVAAVLGGTTRRPCPFPLRGRRCGNLLPRRGRRRGGAPFPSRGRANHRGNKQSPASSTSRFLQQPAHAAYCLPSRGGGPATHLSSDCGGAPLLRLLHVARRPGAHRHDFLTRLRRRKHSFTPPASPREPTNPAPPS